MQESNKILIEITPNEHEKLTALCEQINQNIETKSPLYEFTEADGEFLYNFIKNYKVLIK